MPGVVRADSWGVTGVGPTGAGQQHFTVEAATVDGWYSRGYLPKYYDVVLLRDILEAPTSIFRGLLRRGMEEDGYCYCGKPAVRFLGGPAGVAPPEGMVFAAYIFYSPRLQSLVPVDWDWWPEDPAKPGHPEEWQKDYQERTWPTN